MITINQTVKSMLEDLSDAGMNRQTAADKPGQLLKSGRPKKKPYFDADLVMQEFMDVIAEAYENTVSENMIPMPGVDNARQKGSKLKIIAEEFNITPLKVRKLLITAGYHYHIELYSTSISRKVNDLYEQGKSVAEVMELTGLSRASVNGYLPYSKSVYKLEEVSVAADRIRLYRERKLACESLQKAILARAADMDDLLWEAVAVFAGYPFYTSKGFKYSYTVNRRRDGSNGGEMFISRKEKSITRATVLIAFHKALELMEKEGKISGPKRLGTFGASYLYPIFIRLFLGAWTV